jgi:two-component system nitrogen regulation response regulator GlnG
MKEQSALDDVSTASVHEAGGAGPAPRGVPALTVISHPRAHRAGEQLLLEPLLHGREVSLSRGAPLFTRAGSALGLPLADPFVSRKPLRFLPGARGGVRLVAEEGGTRVLVDGLPGERWDFEPEALESGVPLVLGARLVLLLHTAEPGEADAGDDLGLVGRSAAVRRVRRRVLQVADLDVPVLIRGETGTGKELVAQALHQRSRRRQGPFLSVNLATVPPELAAAELFGVERGAYTGATRDREGFFRAARGGTLFLDEVGEASPEVQGMLLRVLETGEMFPVGASHGRAAGGRNGRPPRGAHPRGALPGATAAPAGRL